MVRRARRRRLDYSAGVVDELLSPNLTGALELLSCRFPPGASSGEEPYTHSGEEAGVVLRGRLELWVDGQDRLLQVRASTRFDFTKAMLRADRLPDSGQLPDGGAVEIGRATDVSTMEFGGFGAPADISAPPVRRLQGSSSSGFAEIKMKRTCS